VIIKHLCSTGVAFAGNNMNLTGDTLDRNIIERKVLLAVMRKRNLCILNSVWQFLTNDRHSRWIMLELVFYHILILFQKNR
jgi:hypothetical protein